MKRFNEIIFDSEGRSIDSTMEAHHTGEWVKWEDAEEEIARLTCENEGLSEMYDDLYKHHTNTYHTGEMADTEIVREESKRLREALDKISKLSSGSGRFIDDYGSIAREALNK